jgi:hypothetical protein
MHKTHSDLFKILDGYKDRMTGECLAELQRDRVLFIDQAYEDWTA